MKTINPKFLISLGALLLIGICVVVSILLYFPRKARAVYSRPLVLIHEPLNREHISLGDHALVHATARNANGITRIELWVNDQFYFAQETPSGEILPSLPLMVPWEPAFEGEYTLVVRAISNHDVAGQASIRVQVEETEIAVQADEATDVVEEDVHADTTTESDSAPTEDADEMDTGTSGGPGSPGSGPPSGGAPAPSADDPAPPESDSPPGSADDLTEDLGIGEPEPEAPLTEDPIELQVEALALQISSEYESLHCYVDIAHLEPQWLPDADHDQSTDESFASYGDGYWNVDEYLAGDQAPIFNWPGNEAIPINFSCVGIVAGGTDSIPLGRIDIAAEPDTWDGTTRHAESSGEEGVFSLDYRINGSRSMGFPTILNPSIPPPFNVRTSGTDAHLLEWDWEPNPELDPEDQTINGFYVNVNGTRQFLIDHPTVRAVALPPEWFTPPCGTDYTYTVQAWRSNPDDPTGADWSYDSDPYVVSRDTLEECDISAFVTFDTLNINHYGDDEIGPVLLMLNVSSEGSGHMLALDGWCRDESDPACVGIHLNPDWAYALSDLMSMGDGHFVRVPLSTEGLILGYVLFAQDSTGGELVCEGAISIPGEELFDDDGTITEYTGTLVSRTPDERCQVEFSIRSELIGASGLGDPTYPPLPQLYIDEIRTNEDGYYWINVHNSSSWPGSPSATWQYPLEVLLTRNSGEEIDRFTLPPLSVTLAPGEEVDVYNPDNTPIERVEDLCVTLDPDNLVLESVERDNPGWTAPPECLDIPDLVIENAGFDADSNLVVTVQNRGSGPVEGNQIRIKAINSLGLERIFVGHIFTDGLYPWESAPIEIASSGLADLISSYEGRYGLTLIVDPTDEIVEADETNNRFAFGEGPGRVRVIWGGFDYGILEEHLGGYTYSGLSVTYYPVEDEHNYDYFHARIYVEDGVESRLVDQFDIGCTVVRGSGGEPDHSYGEYDHNCLGYVDEHNPTTEFYLANGEGVRITLNGEIYDDDAELSGSSEEPFDMGTMTFYFAADELAGRPGCRDSHPQGIHKDLYIYPSGFSVPWYAGFSICAVTD